MVGSDGATPAVTTFGNAGLVGKDPAAWQSDPAAIVTAITDIRKRMRHIGVLPKQPNRSANKISIGEKGSLIDLILYRFDHHEKTIESKMMASAISIQFCAGKPSTVKCRTSQSPIEAPQNARLQPIADAELTGLTSNVIPKGVVLVPAKTSLFTTH
jgi:hypothetical protein